MDIREEIKISSYTSGFNLIQNEFDWKKTLLNHMRLADEVVVAINTSEDDTLEEVKAFAAERDKIEIIETDFSYLDPDLDGKIKNAALQATEHEMKVGLDMDEMIDPAQKERWRELARVLRGGDEGAFFVPVIDLYRDIYSYKNIGQKWYLHKNGLYRGTVNFAKNSDGTHDVDRSDSCELINKNGDLVKTAAMISLSSDEDSVVLGYMIEMDLPRVFHLGYLDLRKKILRNKNFWKDHWAIEAGKHVDIPLEEEQLQRMMAGKHGLDVSFLEDE
jgi:hypothetical protein